MSSESPTNVTRSNSLISNLSRGDYYRDISPKICRSEISTKIEYDRNRNLFVFDERLEEAEIDVESPNIVDVMDESDQETVIYCPRPIEEAKISDMIDQAVVTEDDEDDMLSAHEEDITLVPSRLSNALLHSEKSKLDKFESQLAEQTKQLATIRRITFFHLIVSITLHVVLIAQLIQQNLKGEEMTVNCETGYQYQTTQAEVVPAYNFWSVAFLTTMFYANSIYQGISNGVLYFWQMRNDGI